jgi:hypothetical protein
MRRKFFNFPGFILKNLQTKKDRKVFVGEQINMSGTLKNSLCAICDYNCINVSDYS